MGTLSESWKIRTVYLFGQLPTCPLLYCFEALWYLYGTHVAHYALNAMGFLAIHFAPPYSHPHLVI